MTNTSWAGFVTPETSESSCGRFLAVLMDQKLRNKRWNTNEREIWFLISGAGSDLISGAVRESHQTAHLDLINHSFSDLVELKTAPCLFNVLKKKLPRVRG